MASNYSPIYIDLNDGKEFFLDKALESPYALVKYIQTQADYIWTINHNKNSDKVVIQVNDGIDLPEIKILDGNNVQIIFSQPMIGTAILVFFDKGIAVPVGGN